MNHISGMMRAALSAAAMVVSVMVYLAGSPSSYAQTTNISGVINRYTIPVLIDRCNSSIVVKNPAGFAVGDKILIIQMKGAEINTTNTSSFGDVTSLHNAGNYELATIDEVNGFTLVLQHRLVREYDLSGHVQVVHVPQYVNATVTSTLTAKPWDGTTGGVLAFIASGTVMLNADMIVVGKGFRGGVPDNLTSQATGNNAQYYAGGENDGSPKGEGVAEISASLHNGFGKAANAGGGGNSRAAGGGGGANAGIGGQGGYQPSYISPDDIGGRGGAALAYSNTQGKIFLGGGGGSAGYEDDVDKHPVAGTAGGGIILIRASAIDGNGNIIDASGEANTGGDNNGSVIGGGGGAAGGVVLLDIPTYSSTVTVNANGGKGSSTSDDAAVTCYGPGGGGGGGCIWISSGSIPANLTAHHDKGAAGMVQVGAPPPSCQGTTYGAAAGDDGLVVNGLQIPEGTVPR